jgi:glycosyltransferase involved in cell wall biosynthesis
MDIVYIAAGTWEAILQRTQAIAIELAREDRVLYVNSTLHSVLGTARRILTGKSPARPGIREVQKNLMVLDLPPGPLPGGCNVHALNRGELWCASLRLRRWVEKLGFRDYILWIATPWAAHLAGYLDPMLVCYDCMDNVPAFFPPGRQRALVRDLEQWLIAHADVVFASAKELYDACRTLNPEVHIVGNGVWTAEYAHAQPAPALECLPRPVLGYIGWIGSWVDQAVIALLAERFTTGSLVVVGPVHADISQLRGYPNVHFVGRKPHAEIPAYIQGFDVCLIPFVIDELATAVDPVKFYEYCAAGKPVVASALPELERYRDLCYLAESPTAFVSRVEEALAETKDSKLSKSLPQRRRALASEKSWGAHAARIREVLAHHCNRKDPAVASALPQTVVCE